MAHTDTKLRVPDGYRDRLLTLAERLSETANDVRAARYDRSGQGSAMLHASIDAEHVMADVADELRRLRR